MLALEILRKIWQQKWLIIVVGILIGVTVYGVIKLSAPMVFPINNVTVRGDFAKKDQDGLQKLLQPLVKDSFFKIDLNAINRRLQQLLWVEHAEVKRIWPGQIKVHVQAKKAVARRNDKEFLNAYGEKFNREEDENDSKLPQFKGADDDTILILAKYQRMNAILMPLKLKVASIVVNSSESWCIMLDNSVVLQLGAENILEKLSRFVREYNKVLKYRSLPLHSVDLRYEHGIAVK